MQKYVLFFLLFPALDYANTPLRNSVQRKRNFAGQDSKYDRMLTSRSGSTVAAIRANPKAWFPQSEECFCILP